MQLQNRSTKKYRKKCIGNTKPITCRPADLIPAELDTLRGEMAQWSEQEEDVLTYALFPQVATEFFKYREAQETKVDPKMADTKKWSLSGINKIKFSEGDRMEIRFDLFVLDIKFFCV